MLSIRAGAVDVWWSYPDRVRSRELLDRQFAILSESERIRQQRFVYERNRRQFLVSHAMVRETLSRYAPVAPEAWEFVTNASGRPQIALPAFRDLRFSLSHTAGISVVAVARNADLGVDVESTRTIVDFVEIARRHFCPEEAAQVFRNPDVFFDLWTLKEAYVKARGKGLAIPLDSFSFDLSRPTRPALSIYDTDDDDPLRWRIAIRRRPRYRLALAVAFDRRTDLTVAHRIAVPFPASMDLVQPACLL